jgi:hypothetical protein
MSIIGNKDKISVSGQYNISNTGVIGVTGATGFPTSVKVGDSVVVGSAEYVINSISGSTGMTVFTAEFGGATGITAQSAQTIYFQQKPKYVKFITDPSSIGGRSDIYGVDEVEESVARTHGVHPQHAGWVRVKQGSGYVTSIDILEPGSAYGTSVPTVSFSGTGGASGVAVVASGAVTGVTINGAGGSYTTVAPYATFGAPPKLVFNTNTSVNTSSEAITFTTNHNLNTGDRLVYKGASGATGAIGLTYNTTYYAKPTGATGVQLYTTLVGAQTGATTPILVNLTADSVGYGVYLQGITAVGATSAMGGRFNRKTAETLVVLGDASQATMGDAEDTIFPDS